MIESMQEYELSDEIQTKRTGKAKKKKKSSDIEVEYNEGRLRHSGRRK